MASSHRHTPGYSVWSGMRTRCNNPRHKYYEHYGGRGIQVCERWESFLAFLEDMGERPSPEHTLDRKDNDAGYCPENCRWATWKEQMNNTSLNKILTVCGVSRTMKQWSEILGIAYPTLQTRIRQGWAVEKALFEPLQRIRKSSP